MKKSILSLLFLALPLLAVAQTKIACFSYDGAFRSMPEYATVQQNLETLKAKYDAETKRAEDEFNAKYEAFLDGQRTFVSTILQKRQAELQELMDKNVAFKKEAARLLSQAEQDAYRPLRDKLNALLKRIAAERGYVLIINTDNNACPYIDQSFAEDINNLVREALK